MSVPRSKSAYGDKEMHWIFHWNYLQSPMRSSPVPVLCRYYPTGIYTRRYFISRHFIFTLFSAVTGFTVYNKDIELIQC